MGIFGKFSVILLLVAMGCLPALFAVELVEETGEEAGQREIEIIPGILDFDGFLVLILSFGAVVVIILSTRIGGIMGKFLKILLLGVVVIGINIAFGDLWDPFSLHNPFIDDVEDLLEIIGFAVIFIAGLVFYHDFKGLTRSHQRQPKSGNR